MAVKTYSAKKDRYLKLSENFSVWEFQCHNGDDVVLVNTLLIDILERLIAYMDAQSIDIYSGYRTPEYSVSVGGKYSDQHTKGNAADIYVNKKGGGRYTANEVCCALEDLGHQGGIGRMSGTVHVDVRGYKCWFDELANEKIVSSWYEYLGIARPTGTPASTSPTVTSEDPTVSGKAPTIPGARTGVDIYHGDVVDDFNKLRAAGVEFAILQAGYGRFIEQKDPKFEQYYSAARAAGMQVGAYWYSYAVTPEQARMEAQVCLEAIRGKRFDTPIYYDVEEQKQVETGPENVSAMIAAFCAEIEKAGYAAGIYSSVWFVKNYIAPELHTTYSLWIAHYGVKECGYDGPGTLDIWQPDGASGIDGVRGTIDIDYAYTDFAFAKEHIEPESACVIGDVNGDGKVNSSDARTVLRAAAKLEELNDAQKKAADADVDGRVTSADARKILKKAAKKDE